jgi:hypothetical protein
MAEETEDSAPRDYATTDEVSAVAGVERAALGEWVRAGLLPAPNWTGGRGVIAKWPRSALKIAAFVRSQRELGFGLQDIRARIIAAFGDKVLEILAEPRIPWARTAKPKPRPKPKPKPTAKRR